MIQIAQLIKLKDYISRYEWNSYRYSSQYIRLKQDNWKKLVTLWENEAQVRIADVNETDKQSSFEKLKSFFKRHEPENEEAEHATRLPKTKNDLKQYFLDQLYPIQLKWATSTVTDVSITDKDYLQDDTLKYFLQRFPDIYLLLYYPVINIKQTPIDSEIILISPLGVEIIHLKEESNNTTILVGDNRTWAIEKDYTKTNIISPMITLKRTEHIVKSILSKHDMDVPIYKTVLSRTNNIVFSDEPYMTNIIGKFQYEDWFIRKRQLNSTLKSWQLKVVEILLEYCLTTSMKRPEWEEDDLRGM